MTEPAKRYSIEAVIDEIRAIREARDDLQSWLYRAVAARDIAIAALEHLRSEPCACGAWRDRLDERPHVLGCAVGIYDAFIETYGAGGVVTDDLHPTHHGLDIQPETWHRIARPAPTDPLRAAIYGRPTGEDEEE